MRTWTIIGLALIILHQCILQHINSILLMELMGLAVFYYLGTRFKRSRVYTRERRSHFSTKGYYRPKVHKPWREYRSTIEVSPKTWVDEQMEKK